MKEFDLNGITYLRPLEGTAEWYYALDYPTGDLYEAEEIYDMRKTVNGSSLYLIHYPDGEVLKPLESRQNVVIGEPVYDEQEICFAAVDFEAGEIRICRFSCALRVLDTAAVLPLDSVKDCYNLRLHVHPLTLSRQPNDGTFDLVWPERKTIEVSERESFFYRDGDRLFFSRWYEDPDYREELVIRDAETGDILKTSPGDIQIMPNGEVWYMKG